MIPEILKKICSSVEQTADNEYLVVCPFHDDHKASLSVNAKKGVFNCHACGATGVILKLLAKLTKMPEAMVAWDLNNYAPLSTDYLGWHRKLLNSAPQLDYLQDKRKWTLETIKDMKLGYNGERITIPIFDCFGCLVNVRFYKPGATKHEHKVHSIGGQGKSRLLYNRGLLLDEFLILTEGEPDCICAISAGFAAATQTAGAGHFNLEWALAFKDKRVYICYDTDEPGSIGAKKTAGLLQSCAEVGIIDLSTVLKSGKDLTDYFLQGASADDFVKLVEATPLQARTVSAPVARPVDDQVYEVNLSESSQEKYYRKRVRMKVMVSGKMLSPYIIPKEVSLTCPLPNLSICKGCAFPNTGGAYLLKFDETSEDLLSLIETVTENHGKIFKKVCGIPQKCNIVAWEVKEAQNIEESKVIPDLDYSTDESQYVLRQIFYIGHGIEPNSIYEIEGLAIPHPKTQQVTYVISKATSLEDTVSAFKVTDEVISNLRIFSVNGHKEED